MRIVALALAVAAMVACGGCDLLGRGPEIRYRITVEVNTPTGVRSSSGVWSLKLEPGSIDKAYSPRFRGEAIPVDLPNGQTMFALLDLRGRDDLPVIDLQWSLPEQVYWRRYKRFPDDLGVDRWKRIRFIRQHMRERVRLDCTVRPKSGSECPALVRFRDPKNRLSAEALNSDDLSASFGRGYSLKGFYLQVTDDRPTHQIGARLPWERSIGAAHLDGSRGNNADSLTKILSLRSFKRWDS